VVPLKGSTPDRVKLLVLTKDVWSLRLAWDISATNAGLERLIFQPAETNLAGLHHTAGATFVYQPLSTSLGLRYSVPRILDSHIGFAASTNVIFNNPTGSTEGSYGLFSLQQPLWSARTEWAWYSSLQWRDEMTRRYSQAALALFDSKLTPQKDKIPDEYRSDIVQAQLGVVRSFGWARKNDFVLALEASHSRFSPDDLSKFDPIAAADYVKKRVPVSDDRYGPTLEWRAYSSSFTSVLDLDSLGLQEDWRLGHFLDVKLYPVSQNFGSTRTFFGIFAEAGETIAIRDALFRVDVQNVYEANVAELLQGMFTANTFFASPRTPIGRIVWSGQLIDRYANYLNQTTLIGASTRLRGYPTNYFVGQDAIASNLELRTRPIEILKVQVGAAAFYDVASAFDSFSNIQPKQSAGVGIRALLPTFDRIVFRVDVGFPISASPLPADVGPVNVLVTFAQPFSPPVTGSPSQSAGAVIGSTSR